MLNLQTFEDQIQELAKVQQSALSNASLNPQMMDNQLFSMKQDQEFGMPSVGSFLKVKDANVVVITLGVIMSSTVGGFVSRFLPSISQWAPVIAGALLIFFGKGKSVIKEFGIGVLIGGLAQVFSGLGGQLGESFSLPMGRQVEEDRLTYGGSDGVYPTQPDRRVFQ